jgi:NAD(P)-dependent dehydrogenase (short-subunit alcohol dehydrogenase family)
MRLPATPPTRRRALAGLAAGLVAPMQARAQPAPPLPDRAVASLRTAVPSRVLVTGSSDGLGLAAARLLIAAGHHVVLHGRNQRRADDAMSEAPGAAGVVVGDVSIIAETRDLATRANRLGAFDAVIHNVGIGPGQPDRKTPDGLPQIFVVNTLAPFLLTALMTRPKRLVYLSSSAHHGADPAASDITFANRPDSFAAYAQSKFQDLLLAFAVARRWPGVLSNGVDPGWVRTRMGGPGAPLDLIDGALTQSWLAVTGDPAAKVSGRYFTAMRQAEPIAAAHNPKLQDALIAACERISGVRLPA